MGIRNQVVVEINGNTDGLRDAIKRAGYDVESFSRKAANVGDSAKGAKFGLDQLVPAFNGLAARALGVDSTLGTLAGTVGSFAAGGAITGVALVGLTILGVAFKKFGGDAQKAAEDAAEAAKKIKESIDDASGATLRRQIQAEKDAIASLQHDIANLTGPIPSAGPTTLTTGSAKAASQDLAAAKQREIAEKQSQLVTLQTELSKRQREAEVRDLSAVLGANVALNAQRERSIALVQQLRKELERTTDAGKRAELASQIKSLESPDGDRAKKVADEAKKAQTALSDFLLEAARITAQAAGDEIGKVTQQIADLEAKAKKAGALDTPGFATARATLEQQRSSLEAARQVASEEEDRANRARQTAELTNIAVQARLGDTEARVQAMLSTAEVAQFGLLGLADDQVQALADEAAGLEHVLTLQNLSNDARVRTQTLLDQIRAAIKGAEGTGDVPTPPAKPAHEWADEIARGGRALLDAASAAGLLDANMANALNSAINLAESLPKALAGDASGIAGSVAALLNLGAGLFSGPSPEEIERQKVTRENTEAIRALTRHVGDLAGLNVSGASFASSGLGLTEVVRRLGNAGYADRTKLPDEDIGMLFSNTGLDMATLQSIADTLHITLDGTAGSLRKLSQAINTADVHAFSDSWTGILDEMETLNSVDNITDVLGQLTSFVAAIKRSGSSTLQGVLGTGDISTDAGRAAVRAAARQVIDDFRNGLVSASTFGNLTPAEFLAALKALVGDIDAVGQSASDTAPAADAAAAAISQLNAALSDIALLGDLVGQSTDTVFQSIDAAAAAFPKFADGIRGLVAGLDLGTADGQRLFKERVAHLATDLARNGLTDDERGVLQFLSGLVHGLPALGDAATDAATSIDTATTSIGGLADAAVQFVADVSSALSQIQSDGELLGLSPGQVDAKGADFFNNDPTLRGLFGITDAGNPATLDAQKKHAQDILSNASAFPPEIANAARSFIAFANGILTRANVVVGEFTPLSKEGGRLGVEAQSLTQATGVRLADLTAGIRADVHDILGLLSVPRGALPVPQIPGFGLGGGGGVTNIIGPITFEIPSGMTADQGYAVGSAFAGGLADGLTTKGLSQVRDAFTRDYAFSKLITGGRVVR